MKLVVQFDKNFCSELSLCLGLFNTVSTAVDQHVLEITQLIFFPNLVFFHTISLFLFILRRITSAILLSSLSKRSLRVQHLILLAILNHAFICLLIHIFALLIAASLNIRRICSTRIFCDFSTSQAVRYSSKSCVTQTFLPFCAY